MEKGILDTINTNPVFIDTLPSTGKKFKFRGYTAGEEQALLVAKESNNFEIILANIKEIITRCTFEEVDPEKISSFDIEWLLLVLRAKSVGEEIELSMVCTNDECKKTNDLVLNIDDIKKPVPETDSNVVELNENVSVIMKWPGFNILEQMNSENKDVFAIVASLIKQVVRGQDVIETSELNPEEVVRFTKGLKTKTLKKLSNFIYNTPSISHKVGLKCMHCGKNNEYNFKGVSNFFG